MIQIGRTDGGAERRNATPKPRENQAMPWLTDLKDVLFPVKVHPVSGLVADGTIDRLTPPICSTTGLRR